MVSSSRNKKDGGEGGREGGREGRREGEEGREGRRKERGRERGTKRKEEGGFPNLEVKVDDVHGVEVFDSIHNLIDDFPRLILW